jgi:tetratricopeptide (TPR) repeat protein
MENTKFWLIFIITFFINSSIAHANDSCLVMADYFMENENYDQAITEYMRFIYFSRGDNYSHLQNPSTQDQEIIAEVLYKIGVCYRNQDEWQKAIHVISQSLRYTTNDSLRDNRKLSLAIIRIATADYSAAEMELIRLIHFTKINSVKYKSHFFLGICHLYQFRWQEAQIQFKEYYLKTVKNPDPKLDSLLSEANSIHYRSPQKAKWLSTFIPGTGQAYSGDIKNGLNALAINLLTGYLVTDAFMDERYQDLILSHIALFLRFYQGNRANAEYTAESYNDRLNKKTAKRILDYLESNCK